MFNNVRLSIGHFTQLVWKSSSEVGIGRAQSRDGKWFVVANFFPAGNFIGRNAENVFPPGDGKVTLPAVDSKTSTKGKQAGKSRCGLGLGELAKITGFLIIFLQRLKLESKKIGTLLGFAKAHHKIPHRRKSGRGPVP